MNSKHFQSEIGCDYLSYASYLLSILKPHLPESAVIAVSERKPIKPGKPIKRIDDVSTWRIFRNSVATPGGADIKVRIGTYTGLDITITKSEDLWDGVEVKLEWASRAVDLWTGFCVIALIPIAILQVSWTIHTIRHFDVKDLFLELLPPFALRAAEQVLLWVIIYLIVFFSLLYLGKFPLRIISWFTKEPFRKSTRQALLQEMFNATQDAPGSESRRQHG